MQALRSTKVTASSPQSRGDFGRSQRLHCVTLELIPLLQLPPYGRSFSSNPCAPDWVILRIWTTRAFGNTIQCETPKGNGYKLQLEPADSESAPEKVGKKSSNEMKRYKFFMVDEKTNQFPTLFTHVSDISHSELPRLLHLPDMLPTTEYIRDDLGNKLYPMLSDRL